jgi:hypothetical protein
MKCEMAADQVLKRFSRQIGKKDALLAEFALATLKIVSCRSNSIFAALITEIWGCQSVNSTAPAGLWPPELTASCSNWPLETVKRHESGFTGHTGA